MCTWMAGMIDTAIIVEEKQHEGKNNTNGQVQRNSIIAQALFT